jgi:asparagine synthase (glutamine-hydrolysing)
MCGIVGFISQNEQIDILQKMLDVQSYRGPDDNGVYFDETTGVHLGHNRLAIQDLSSKGHQPFLSDCGNYVLSFNGEVYNFKQIKKELENLGYNFISNTDTEVILYAYKQWGIKTLQKLIGMFAFCLFDKLKNKLFLVRDRAGVKPLYYYQKDKQFFFSSELKSFHKHPSFDKKQNIQVLPYYFQFGYIPAPHTIFENCYKLEAGHFLEYDLKSFTCKTYKYWDVNDYYLQERFKKSEKTILDELEDLLDNAIDLRMVADVPVGLFLSGGYDSSLIAAILAKKQAKKINTFTIGFTNPKYNEAKHAKEIATFLGTNHTEHYIDEKEMLDLVEKLPFFYDEPFGDSSALPTMVVSKLAKKYVSVVLSGDGGDETFCGYSKYFFLDKMQSLFSTNFKKKFLEFGVNLINEKRVDAINEKLPKNLMQTNVVGKYIKFKRALKSKNQEEMFENASSYVDKHLIQKFLKIQKKSLFFEKWGKIGKIDFLNQMMAIDYKLFMRDDVLVKVDRATMSVSLEGREPLLDHRLIEYMARVPLSIKYKNNQGKFLLRQILYKYLPKTLVDKPKAGFQIPLNEWLRNELRPLVENYINQQKLDSEIFDIKEVMQIKTKFFLGEEFGTIIWFILMYQMWKEKWLE